MSQSERATIEQFVARFFEKSDDLIAVSSSIAATIEDRRRFREGRNEREKAEWSKA